MASTTASGGRSGPFKAREGFDANSEKGINFLAPDLPTNLQNPSGDGTVVQTEYFWDHANFIRWDGRQGNLPDPLTEEIVSGEQYAIRMDFGGRDLGRIAVWDGNLVGQARPAIAAGSVFPVRDLGTITAPGDWNNDIGLFFLARDAEMAGDYMVNATGADQVIPNTPNAGALAGQTVPDGGLVLDVGDYRLGTNGYAILGPADTQFDHTGAAAVGTTPGNWRFLNVQSWLKGLQSDPDQPTDQRAGDFQTTLEQQGKELKIFQNGTWHKIYSEVDVRAWIAALSLFEGTVQEVGGGVANVLEFTGLPDLTLNTQIDQIAHYYTFTGTPGYTIQATDPNGVGRDLPGTILNPGDWLQVSNRSGDAANPDLRWTHVGGDLLAKSRGDNLYGLKLWAAGGWEVGSLVVHDSSIWRATGPVTATDPAPGELGAPWSKVDLAAGVRWVQLDGDLPANAPAGEIFFVLQSAQAQGTGALYYWDGGANAWQPLGGSGGNAMELNSGIPIVNVGLPIGAITMWAVANPPPGWLICNGQAFDAGQYPELAAVLGVTNVPDLRGQFIRGANGTTNPLNSQQQWTTGEPKAGWTVPDHSHSLQLRATNNTQDLTFWGRASAGGNSSTNWNANGGATNPSSVSVTGGDSETAPDHYCLHYIVKAADIVQRVRI